jgi:hypothetical protein
MAYDDATHCGHCGTLISDPTTRVVHGDMTYCCANCAAAMEQSGSGSDPHTLRQAGDLRCDHCGCVIVNESTLQSRDDRAYCCPNCLNAAAEATASAAAGPETLPVGDRSRTMR